MHPVPNEGLRSGKSFCLSYLVLVMGKDQIGRPSVDVESHTEVPAGHHGTFDVPPRPSRSPRRWPRRFTLFRRLPQSEIHRMFLGLVRFDPLTGSHVLERTPGQAAVTIESIHGEEDISIRLVGSAPFDQTFDSFHHVFDVGG